jgi:cyclophilin family peptidyl-prolyl cis-trans isomerase
MIKKLTILIYILFIAIQAKPQYEYPDIVMETTAGTIKLMLYDNAYQHSENFIKLVKEGFYNGQLFHRVIKDFMIQAGDDKSKNAKPNQMLGTGGKQYTIPAEFFPEYYHKKGALAAARQSDNVNPKKESSGSQFYIVEGTIIDSVLLNKFVERKMHPPFTEEQKKVYSTIGGTPHLDYQYTVFGEVYEGLEVVDKICKTPVNNQDRPIEDVRIIKMYTIKNKRKNK